MKIVIVDNSPDAAGNLHMLLGIQGHSVLLAFSGKTGLELVYVAEPDLVIVDLSLPDMDAIEVIRNIHASLEPKKCRLVALTGLDDFIARRRAVEAGVGHLFVKSRDIERLLALTNREIS